MKYLGILLHCYQPPWQDKEVLDKIVNQCYQPLFDFILWHPELTLTVNINYSLLELLKKYRYQDLINAIRRSVELGRIELAGSGAYHPILPLLPENECRRQILLNEQGIEAVLGKYLKNGFFPPEMAFHPELARIVKKIGYRWLIADDLPFVCQHGFAPYNFIPMTKGLPILLRSRLWSQALAFKEFSSGWKFVEHLKIGLDQWFGEKNGYLIIALDAETFGHHQHNYFEFLHEIEMAVKWQMGLRFVFLSEILSHFPTKKIEVPAGSWSTLDEDFKKGISFPLWWHPENRSQQLLWNLIDTLLLYLDNKNSEQRQLMDKALNSCQFWWLSKDHWSPTNALKTIPIYLQIIKHLNLPERILKKIKKIFQNLEIETGCQISI